MKWSKNDAITPLMPSTIYRLKLLAYAFFFSFFTLSSSLLPLKGISEDGERAHIVFYLNLTCFTWNYLFFFFNIAYYYFLSIFLPFWYNLARFAVWFLSNLRKITVVYFTWNCSFTWSLFLPLTPTLSFSIFDCWDSQHYVTFAENIRWCNSTSMVR